ncbi:MAG: M23 family metallopeptidase [Candidatus Kerfeldbacteria bacterium]|jgi:murein DD-endopeptidase MepM/ murein hydrolase activator NlpD
MLLKKLLIALSVIAMVATLALVQGCSENENPIESSEISLDLPVYPDDMAFQADTISIDSGAIIGDVDIEGGAAKRYAALGIAWPFGRYEHPNWWRGDEGWKTGGGTITACGRRLNSHTGADWHARDFSRYDGSQWAKPIYAGISGKVVKAGNSGGYGNCVVIYDAGRHVAVRYAHLILASVVGVGQYVRAGQHIGWLGNSPGGFTEHLHLVAYENVVHNNGNPIIPSVCSPEWYSCATFFYWW